MIYRDDYIAAAFEGTNFGRDDLRSLLAHSVLKKVCGHHCGHTITQIMKMLKLIGSKSEKPTRLGKDFMAEYFNTSRNGG